MRSRARILGLAAVALAATMAATSCAGPHEAPSSSSPTSSHTAAAAPPKPTGPLTAVVNQFRDDYGTGTIVLQLDNRTSARMTVLRAELADAGFDSSSAWTGSVDLPPDQPLSLPTTLTGPTCSSPAATSPSVRAVLATGDAITVPASDPHDVLPRLRTEQCFALLAHRSTDLSFADQLLPGPSPQTAVLGLIVAPPAGNPAVHPELTLVSVSGTTLLADDPSAPWPHDLALTADGSTVPLTFRPARCDPHAVAEDKIGTLIPLTLNVAGQTGVVKVPASPGLKAALYAFVAKACGW